MFHLTHMRQRHRDIIFTSIFRYTWFSWRLLDSQSSVILILSVLTFFFQARQMRLRTGTLGITPLTYINCHPNGFWGRSFYGSDAHLSPNQQCQSTEDIASQYKTIIDICLDFVRHFCVQFFCCSLFISHPHECASKSNLKINQYLVKESWFLAVVYCV